MSDRVPRILYVGDVPIEATIAGATLLYRLFDGYPAERLTVFQSNLPIVLDPERRLPAVRYEEFRVANRRLLNSRVAGLYAAVPLLLAGRIAEGIRIRLASSYDGVVTIAHRFSWLVAARLAESLSIPLHIVLHDDCIETTGIAAPFRNRVERVFGGVLAATANRFSVSPGMQEHCRSKYGVSSEVILPTRARNGVVFTAPPPRGARNGQPFTVAYTGSLSAGYIPAMERLLAAVRSINGRLEIFTADTSQALRDRLQGASINAFVPADELARLLRDRADALYVPMSFEPADAANMMMSFPAKMADVTAVGLPILINGPAYCSVVKWAQAYPGVASVVTSSDPADLSAALAQLAGDAVLRDRLAREALRVGAIAFDQAAAQRRVVDALAAAVGRAA